MMFEILLNYLKERNLLVTNRYLKPKIFQKNNIQRYKIQRYKLIYDVDDYKRSNLSNLKDRIYQKSKVN